MKRFISIILALIMALSLCSTAAFADNAKAASKANASKDINKDAKIIYTALGASESNGYGLPEYDVVNGQPDTRVYKYGHVTSVAYPTMFANAIEADVFNQDCLAGMRSEDLRYLIDPSYPGDEYTHDMAFGSYVMGDLAKDNVTVPKLQELYQKHIKEADVITLCIGLNNFDRYLTDQLHRCEWGVAPYDMPLSEEAQKLFDSPEFVKLRNALSSLGLNYAELLVKGLAYTYTDNLKSFDGIIDRIYELNPDVDLYVMGLYDAIPDLHIYNNMINIGKLNTTMMKSINQHYATYDDRYTYVDVLNTEIIGIPNNIINTDGTNFKDKFYEANSRNVHPSKNGHIYMYNQLAAKARTNGWMIGDPNNNSRLPFTDVPADAWYYNELSYCYGKGIAKGTTDTTFSPNQVVTRAQLATFLYRMAGSPSVSGKTEPFTDVSDSFWAHDAIVWAYNAGVVKGTTATTFDPNSPVTRGQAVTMLCRYEGSAINSNSYTQFKDASSIPGDFRSAVSWAVDNGVVKGYEDGCFHSNYALSRAQMVVILARYDQ